jgi:branched-chain amino acid transport system permease protein
MVFAGIYSLITLGLSVLVGYAGQISLGHAAFFGIGAYTSAVGTATLGWNAWLCLALGALLASGAALVVGSPSLKLRGHYLAMATLAFGIIIYIVFNEEIEITGGPDGMGGIPGLSLGGFKFNSVIRYYYLVWLIVLAAFWFCSNFIQSRVGRAFRSIHGSEVAARAMGVNVSAYKIQAFVFSAILASIAGSLYCHYLNFVNPSTFDLFFSIKLLIMIIMGGMHSIWGGIVGAILITFLSNEWLHRFEEAEVLVYGGVLLIIVMFLPDGLVSLPSRIRSRLTKTTRGLAR